MRRRRWIILLLIIAGAGFLTYRAKHSSPSIADGSYLLLDLGGNYADGPPEDLIGRWFSGGNPVLIEILTTIRNAQHDKRIKGVVVRIRSLDVGWGKLQDLRDALIEYKQSGKPLLALMVNEAGSANAEYFLATAADRIYLAPATTAPLSGLATHAIFLGGVWEKLDIDMQVEKIAEYKTFGDMIINKEMSPAHRQMTNEMLDSLNAQFVGTIAQARNLDPVEVQRLIDECPSRPSEYEAAHLSDGTKHLQDIAEEVGGDKIPLVTTAKYMHVTPESLKLEEGPTIAIVYGVGNVVSNDKAGQNNVLGAEGVSKSLRDASKAKDVKAIVFRIDSPGGSALGSELIWRAVIEAKEHKPVIVSMSDVAASGGYYVAAAATRILAQPTTITGSIGVVFARPAIGRLLERLGITGETISRGRHAAANDLTTPLSPEMRAKLVDEMHYIYDTFVDRVAKGRNLPSERVNELGRGRVWTGAQAKENGLVDELGGLRAAIAAAKSAAQIDAGKEVHLELYPKEHGLASRLGLAADTRIRAALPSWVREISAAIETDIQPLTPLALLPERWQIE